MTRTPHHSKKKKSAVHGLPLTQAAVGGFFIIWYVHIGNDFGKTPGATETPAVTNTADGIRFTVTGLSPISVGWTAPDPEKPTDPERPTDPGRPGTGGGGSGSSGYAVTVTKPEHGKVIASPTSADSGSTVILTVTPDSGYVLDTLTVTDSRGNEIKLTAQGGGKYTFTMPSRAVTIKATFSPLPGDVTKPCDGGADCPSRAFTDLGGVGTWYHEAVDYVLRNNLMGGYGNGLFGPNNNLTRAQLAQILYNREGRPSVSGSSPFTDVANPSLPPNGKSSLITLLFLSNRDPRCWARGWDRRRDKACAGQPWQSRPPSPGLKAVETPGMCP